MHVFLSAPAPVTTLAQVTSTNEPHSGRYDRQIAYEHVGPAGQRRLAASSVAIIGVGGLGSALAESLCRAGVGRLRIVDDDRVDLDNLHRQHLYTEADAAAGVAKVAAATEHLGRLNRQVQIEPIQARLEATNALELIDGVDLVLDGTDNWPARFILNDACQKTRLRWIYAGVVGAAAMTMNIVPGETPCLRCIYDSPPPSCTAQTCRSVGVLGPAVHMIAGLQALEAIKMLLGRLDAISRKLVSFDLWTNRITEFDVAANAGAIECPCCKAGEYDYLDV